MDAAVSREISIVFGSNIDTTYIILLATSIIIEQQQDRKQQGKKEPCNNIL